MYSIKSEPELVAVKRWKGYLLKEAKLMNTSAEPCAFTAPTILQSDRAVRKVKAVVRIEAKKNDRKFETCLPCTGIAISSRPKKSFWNPPGLPG